jgi:hypothetical protein
MNHDLIIGHNFHIYSVVKDWGRLDASGNPVKDCHEMVMDSKGRLFMLTMKKTCIYPSGIRVILIRLN